MFFFLENIKESRAGIARGSFFGSPAPRGLPDGATRACAGSLSQLCADAGSPRRGAARLLLAL